METDINHVKIIDDIDNLGRELTKVIQNGNNNKRLLISSDLLLKTRCNVSILPHIAELRNSTTSINLIYRAIMLDLMTALFLLHLPDDRFEYSCKVLDVGHVKFMKDILPMRLELGRRVFNPQEGEDIDEQKLFDQYYDNFNENLKALSNLYMYYRYLSQTEHYSFLGNKYPFKTEYDDSWYKECNIAIYVGIDELSYLIRQYY